MAIGATWCVGLVTIQSLTVDTGVEIELGVIVTVTAGHSLESLLVGKIVDVGILVAVDAFEVAVHRLEENRVVYKQGNGLAVLFGRQIGVVVTIQTGLIVDRPQCGGKQQENH
jgi:hypothetical protein